MQVAKVKPSRREAFLKQQAREQEARTALCVHRSQIADTKNRGRRYPPTNSSSKNFPPRFIRAIRKTTLPVNSKRLSAPRKSCAE